MGKSLVRKSILWAVLASLSLGVLFLAVWTAVSGPVVVYRVFKNGFDTYIDDFKRNPGRGLVASATPFHFKNPPGQTGIPQTVSFASRENIDLEGLLEASDSIAFLLIKDDAIRHERYFQGHGPAAISQAFSASKSILSLLIGAAIDDGLIQSVDQTVTDFVPELAAAGFGQVSIKDLLQMRSGMDYVEDDNPFGEHVRFNFTDRLRDEILKLKMHPEPSPAFIYKSGDNALLALILERALMGKSITRYLQEKFWTPMGMEHRGMWSLDHAGDGLEKTWCCLAASARDFAKFGRLFLRRGDWDGRRLLSEDWVALSTTGAFDQGTWPGGQAAQGFGNYGYQWWLGSPERRDYLARGKNGQLIYINPPQRMIIVRLGWTNGKLGGRKLTHGDWLEMFQHLADEVR